ncbi:hypothetical protein MKX01_011738 [Papaver californicum]|nr:hypothetical protein MKX01_011738 [Papaver californicum]
MLYRHTGVVVFGSEYYFGGGIQHSPVGTTPYGKPIKVVDLGVTHVPKEIFEEYLQEISPRYTAETYNLLRHNCNNFSNEVAQFLVGTNIPDYILELPNDVLSSLMGAMIIEEKTNSGGDPLGDARSKVQEEITAEFAAIMAPRTLRASEAAALATRRVMERHGLANNAVMSQR